MDDPFKCSPIVEKHIAKVLEKHKKGKQKKKQKKKFEDNEPDFRLTYDLIVEVYKETGIKPARAEYWFREPRKSYPILNRSPLSPERDCGTPIAALAILRRQQLLRNSKADSSKIKFSDFVLNPSYTWLHGSIAQLVNLTCSYILGFDNGFDNNAPGHKSCSNQYHIGYEDGKKLAEKMVEDGLLPSSDKDSPPEILSEEELDELFRLRGYAPEGYTPFLKERNISLCKEQQTRKERLRDLFSY